MIEEAETLKRAKQMILLVQPYRFQQTSLTVNMLVSVGCKYIKKVPKTKGELLIHGETECRRG